MTLSNWISEIVWYWNRLHNPMRKDAAWREADKAEKRAKAAGCTQAIHRARQAKRQAVNLALRSHVKGA